VAVYEYRCPDCEQITSYWCAIADRPATVPCETCGCADAKRIVSGTSVRLSSASKVARLDPKYDKRAEQALRNSAHADPDRLLRRMKPFPKDSKD